MEQKQIPLVSIVILNWNGMDFLSNCLNSIFNTNYLNFEVIFVDNNSFDDSTEFVKNNFGKNRNLKIIHLEKNYGTNIGNNIGAYHASGKYLVFLNVDVEVHPDWIKELVNIFEKDVTIGAAQPKLLFLWDKNRINSMGHYLTSWGSWSNYVTYGRVDDYKNDEVQEIFIAFGAALAVKSVLFNKVGKFDNDFFMYADEIDLSWRIWLSGHRIVVVPTSIVYHFDGGVGGGGIIKSTPFRVYLHNRNLLTTLLKNYSNNNLPKFLPLAILSIIYSAVCNIFKDPQLIPYKLLAIIDFLKNFNKTWKKRIYIQYFLRRVSDDSLFRKGLIRQRGAYAG
jgi:GT2 family glycosyltransferase